MNNEEKWKMINAIRANYGIEVKENLLNLKYEAIKEIVLLIIGIILLIISNLLNYFNTLLLGEIIYIFGWVIIWELAYNIIFIDNKTRIENDRLRKLTTAKIIFKENI